MTQVVGIPSVPQLPSGQHQFLLAVKKSIEQLQSSATTTATTTAVAQTISVLARQNSLVTVTGTVAATTVWAYSVPAYTLGTTRRLRLRASGRYINSTGGAVNMSLFSGFGGQTLFNGTVAVPTNAAAGSWQFDVDVGAYIAATNRQESIGQWALYAAGAIGGVAQVPVANGVIGAHNNTLTVDGNAAQTLTLVHTLGNVAATIETNSVELLLV